MKDEDRALRVVLLAAIVAVFVLFSPFLTTLLVAAVTAVLAWPVHQRVLRLVGGRPAPATLLTVLGLTLGVVGPASMLLLLVSGELRALLATAAAAVQGGALDRLVERLLASRLSQQLIAWSGDPDVVVHTLRESAQGLVLGTLGAVTQNLPDLIGEAARSALGLIIFYMTAGSFLYWGPEFLAWGLRISPLKQAHTRRLYEVFATFASNVVLAGLISGVIQGATAGLGYLITGVERPLLFAVLSGVLAYVPFVGTALVWVPLCLLFMAQGEYGSALALLIWSLVLTASVDNVIKPFLVRGRSDIPPVLIFLGVFGGLFWLGVIGILVGPVLVAMLLALLKIYEESLAEAA
ncbi:MAG TPA: AI-2E family transporter [Myxococcota bacterium]|nr:AI-2E family transporter [Myxococcota bacterium]